MPVRARLILLGTLAGTAAACSLGTFSLGAGPEREDSSVPGGAAGSSSGTGGFGAGEPNGTSGGGVGPGAGSAGQDGSAGSTGGSTGPFGTLMRVSGPDPNTEGNLESRSPSLTADGRFVVYESDATNLVPDDTNQASDIFIFDRLAVSTGRISTEADGTQATGASLDPAVSADGSRISFSTAAPNIFAPAFGFGIVISGSQSNLSDFPFALTPITSPGATASAGSSVLTSDGSSVVFRSADPTLVPGDANERDDYFAYDVASGRTERIVIVGDTPDLELDVGRPDISSDAAYLVFTSNFPSGGGYPRGPRVVRRVVLATQGIEDVTLPLGDESPVSDCYDPSISADGSLVAFVCDGDDMVPGDTNGFADVFVRDLARGVTERVSVASDGTQADGPSSAPALGGDGRRVVFQTKASNLGSGPPLTTEYGALVSHDRVTGETFRITSVDDGGADGPFEDLALTPDGRFLVFESRATGLAGTRTNVRHVYLFEFVGI